MYISRHPFVIGGIHYDAVSSTVHYRAFRKHQGRDTDTISVDAVEFIAVILRDDVIVKILEHVGLPQRSLLHSSQRLDVSVLPVFKPARGPPIQPEEKLAAPLRTRCRTLINRGPLRSAENRGQESVSSAYR